MKRKQWRNNGVYIASMAATRDRRSKYQRESELPPNPKSPENFSLSQTRTVRDDVQRAARLFRMITVYMYRSYISHHTISILSALTYHICQSPIIV
jgi:hypothetical protein